MLIPIQLKDFGFQKNLILGFFELETEEIVLFSSAQELFDYVGKEGIKYSLFFHSGFKDILAFEYFFDINIERHFKQKEEWENIYNRIKVFIKIYSDLKSKKILIMDVIPRSFLVKYYSVLGKYYEYFIQKIKESHFKHLKTLRRIKILEESIQSHPVKFGDDERYVYYNFFKNSFRMAQRGGEKGLNVLSLTKQKKNEILPTNDYFLSFDYKGFGVRALLYETFIREELNQVEDIYLFLKDKFGWEHLSREEVKNKVFKIFHGDIGKEYLGEETFYDLQKRFLVLDDEGDRWGIKTYLQREILKKVEYQLKTFLSYLQLSLSNEIVLITASKVNIKLRNYKTFLKFIIYDNVILDVKKEEEAEVLKICKETMEKIGDRYFPVKIYKGKNLNNMKEYL